MKNSGILLVVLLALAVIAPRGARAASDTCRMQVGMNLSQLNNSSRDLPFVDLMKTASEWITQPLNVAPTDRTNSNVIDSIPQDANGYPLELPYAVNGQPQVQIVGVVLAGGIEGKYPAGNYTVLYDGTGSFQFASDAVITSQSAGVIHLLVAPTNAGIMMRIVTSNADDHVRNIRVLLPGTEATYQAKPWNEAFLEKIAKFPLVRFMWWEFTPYSTEALWSQRRTTTWYTQGTYAGSRARHGVAYEYIADLCNAAKKDAWICVPHMADSAYIQAMADLFRDRLEPSHKIYLEFSHEAWNSAYPVYRYIDSLGPAGLTHAQKTAWFAQRVFRIWAREFGAQGASRLVRVAATSLMDPTGGQQMLTYLGAGGCDAYGPAAYFGLPSYAYDSLNALGAAARPADVMKFVRQAMPTVEGMLTQHNQNAQRSGVKLVFYEGGQDVVPPAGRPPSYLAALNDVQIDTSMRTLYEDIFSYLRDGTSATMFVHFCLTSQRQGQTTGAFGALETVLDTNSVKYRVIVENTFNCDTVTPAPDVPVLVSPENGSRRVTLTPLLTWSPAAHATTYGLEVDTTAAFDGPVYVANNIADTTRAIPALDSGVTYHWRVRASNGATPGPWSDPWTFTTKRKLPVQPILISPPNNAVYRQDDPHPLVWRLPDEADTLVLRIAFDPQFRNPATVDSVTRTGAVVTPWRVDTTYYWIVAGVNESGQGPWSELWRFSVSSTAGVSEGGTIPMGAGIAAYPNPFIDNTTVLVAGDRARDIIVTDVYGRTVEHLANIASGAHLGASLPAGVYWLRLPGEASGVRVVKVR